LVGDARDVIDPSRLPKPWCESYGRKRQLIVATGDRAGYLGQGSGIGNGGMTQAGNMVIT